MPYTIIFLAILVIIGQTVQTITGFGSNALILPIGAHVYPIGRLIVALVMLSWLQVSWLTCRNYRRIDWNVLLKRIFPASLIGMPIGMSIYYYLNAERLKLILGIFIIITSTLELFRLYGGNKPSRKLPALAGFAVLTAAGVIHGAFATGGPLIVYYSSRQIDEKGAFRATLAMLWFILDCILLITFMIKGRVDTTTLSLAGYLLPAMIAGVVAGELLHNRVNETAFKKLVQIMLLIAGISLFV